MRTFIVIVALFAIWGYYAFNPPPGKSAADDVADIAREDSMLILLHRQATQQQPWECRPAPGYCDIDTDWRPSPAHK